jgi:5,10-methylenetetrahydromethanopterin reductase
VLSLGVQIIPTMPAHEVIDTALAAEELGYDYCLLADEGFMPDVYVCLGAIAQRTTRLRLGPVTNGYTRNPAVTATAAATLDALSGGRALVTLVAGGSMVLRPMGLAREAPLMVMSETITILRRLWSGEAVTWQGQRYKLDSARLHHPGRRDIPIWLAVRGDKMLELAGQTADGVVLMAKSDLGSATARVAQGSQGRAQPPRRIYLDRIAYTPAMLDEAAGLYAYALMDSPTRLLNSLGLSDSEISALQASLATGGPAAAAKHVTPAMIRNYQIAGTPDECRATLRGLVNDHHLDVFVLNVISSGLAANRRLLNEVRDIVMAQ